MKYRVWCGPLMALTAVFVMNSGIFRNIDLMAGDRLYQERQAADDRIVVIGIDERALEDIGPFQTCGAPLPQEDYGRTVSFGIGIQMEPAVVGNIGAKNRMDYTAIGDTVNTAVRLEANAPAGTIYISRAVADALEGRIRVTSLGNSIQLKGKSGGFEIFALDGVIKK